MHINVTVDGLDAIDLTTVIGDEIAYYDSEAEETVHRPRTLGDLVAEKLSEKIYGELGYERRVELSKQARLERSEVIRAKVEPLIEQALAGPIRLTNTYGEPTGPETTLNALIIEEAKRMATAKTNDGYGRSSTETVLAKFVREQVAAAFTKELAAVVADEKAKVVAAVRAKASELIAEAVKAGVGR